MGFISGIVGGILGANAAGNASDAEVNGAKQAQNLEQENQTNAQNFQSDVWNGTKQNEQPYQALGSTSANHLNDLLTKGFSAPTLADVENTPGYQFNLEQGTNAINQNAAANGTLLTGNTGVALEKYGSGLAENTYNDAYQRALNTYQTNIQGLLSGTQAGLTSTGQEGQLGQSAAGNMANINLTGGQQQAQQINNAAAARASGYLGQANAYSHMLGGAGDAMSSMADLAMA